MSDYSMKKLVFAASWLLAVALPGCWLIFALRAKIKYDNFAAMVPVVHFAQAPINQQDNTFLSEVNDKWSCQSNKTNGPMAAVVSLTGQTPSVRNLIHLFNYQMPEFCWRSPSRNHLAAELGYFKAGYCGRFADPTFHVSSDGHLALLWNGENAVFVFQDAANGFRDAIYFRKQRRVEQGAASNGDSAVAPSP